MKTKIISLIIVGIFLMSSMPICAQKYICLQNDIDAVAVSSDSHIKLYKNSTLLVADGLKVRIVSMTNDAKNLDKNKKGGFIEGAVFNVTKNDTALSKVHYTDGAGQDRYNVDNVTISVNYLTEVAGVEYLIPYSEKAKVGSLTSSRTDLYENVFNYEEANSSIVYVPTATNRLPEGSKLVIDETKIVSNIKEKEPIVVDNMSKIRLITSSEGQYYLDEIFTSSDLKRIDANNNNFQDDGYDKTLKYVLGGIVIVLVVLLFAGVFYIKKIKKEFQEEKEKAAGKQNNIMLDLKNIIKQFKGIQGSFDQMTPLIDQIVKKVSEENDVERLNKEIKQKENALNNLNNTIKERDATIIQKESEIAQNKTQINKLTDESGKLRDQLAEANKLDKGTLIIADGKLLAQKANGLLTVCRKGEEIIKQYITTLPESDNLKMSYFLANYIKEMPSKSRDQWNGVMSTLSIKGFINDLEITRYLQSESDQISWLKKHFIEDLLQSYISPLIIMLDQIRCSKQFGITKPAPLNIEKAINEIIEECKKFGVTVKYKPLFELITTDDKERVIDEIGSDLPKAIEDFVLVKENVPLFFTHIGVVAEGVKDDKTVCIAKL